MSTAVRTYPLNDQRDDDQRDDGHQLYQDVHGRARSVLEGVTDRIADDRRLVRFRTLASVVAFLCSEDAANTLAWGLVDGPISEMIPGGPLAQKNEAFRLLTGGNSPRIVNK